VDRGAKRVAIVAQHDAWGRSRYEPMMQDFKRRGIEAVADEEVTVDQNDGTAQALKLKSSGADAVMVVAYPKAAAVLIRDSIKIGYKSLWIGQTAIQDLPALQGLIGINGALADFVTITTVPGHPDNEQYAEWRKRLKDTFPNDELSVFNLMGIAAAEVFALPSRGEGFGFVYLEAMARGKPVIGGAHGGAPEVIADGETGYLVQHGDPVQLATSIDALLANPDVAKHMGSRGRERVEREFRFNVFAKSLRKILRELCES